MECLVSVSMPTRAPPPQGVPALLYGLFRLVHVSPVEKATTQVHITKVSIAVLLFIYVWEGY